MTTTPPVIPKRAASWRVCWWDFTNYHDLIGRHPVRRGAITRDFFTREAAEKFVAHLSQQIDADELVMQVISLRELLPSRPDERMVPGPWPLQRRGE